ncbi:piggyBac transposable element-derived protein 4-like [Astyanax mexicanus]|uniref:PiggyBac transposable element-derived protein 4-like n=1 Tax=Astyanax mexicanus TaxID=7994 RepID=A0A8T2KMV1_ASTMX|nr:piggyBac transposable element-derived protein 4-like [Astyanax mexicanus]
MSLRRDRDEEVLGWSDEEDEGSEFESGLSGDEELFFNGMDPAQDDPRRALSDETKVPNGSSAEGATSGCDKETQPAKRWNNADEEDIEPFHHKFIPARKPGSILDHTKDYRPVDLFQEFFTTEAVSSLCSNTNKFADIKKDMGEKCKWEPLEPEEFMKFCGILVFMGIIHRPTIADYWHPDSMWQTPYVRKIMRRDRFQAISLSLHISDPESDCKNCAKKGKPNYDKLAKIRPLMESLKTACKASYHPRRNLSIDERMVPTLAKNGATIRLKSCRHTWGYKLFVLKDIANGYTCDFTVFADSDPKKTPNGLSYDSVMSLVDPHFLGTGYILYCDSFFTSPALFMDLHKMKVQACGMAKKNRAGFPKVKKNSLTKTSARGTIKWIRQGPLLFVKWADFKEVIACSTVHKAYAGDVVTRRQRHLDGTCEVREFQVPAPINAYNRMMSGVDLVDPNLQRYINGKRFYRWYKIFFFHFLDIALVNAYLLHKEHSQVKAAKPLSYLDFRKKLCEQLCNFETNPEPPEVPMNHYLERMQGGRRKCRQCLGDGKRSDTIWHCPQCDVPLCGSAARNCLMRYHLSRNLKVGLNKVESTENDMVKTGVKRMMHTVVDKNVQTVPSKKVNRESDKTIQVYEKEKEKEKVMVDRKAKKTVKSKMKKRSKVQVKKKSTNKSKKTGQKDKRETRKNVEPKLEPLFEPKIETMDESRFETMVVPRFETMVEPKFETMVQPKLEPMDEPKIESVLWERYEGPEVHYSEVTVVIE